MAEFIGIVNLTSDSFSDGGRFFSAEAAIEHGERLLADGADWLDLGAESSNPNGENVAADAQIARLVPVVRHFVNAGARVSVDTHRPEVMRAVLDVGANMINDISALRDHEAVSLLQAYDAKVVLMHSRASDVRAEKGNWLDPDPVGQVVSFFKARIATLALPRDRLILDPGMGFFLSSHSDASVEVLRGIAQLRELGLPVYISTSRKSFVAPKKAPLERLPGTLATELWALDQGAEFLRTHDVGAIRQAWNMWQRLRQVNR